MEEMIKTVNNNKKRLDYIDMAKGIGIILVIIGHISFVETHILVWISAFHMPLFFVIAGIMMSAKKEKLTDIKSSISSRVKSLLIPYMWFSILYFFMDTLNLYINNITVENFYVNIISSITFYGKSVMWFLTALFLAEVYFILLKKNIKDSLALIFSFNIALICVLIATKLPMFYANESNLTLISIFVNFIKTFIRAGIVLPFVAVGYVLWNPVENYITFMADRLNSKSTDKITKYSKLLELILGAILTAICIAIAMKNWSVDTNNMIVGNIILYYLGGIFGSLGTLLLCKALPALRIIKFFGRNSLVVMATHLDCYILWAGIKITLILAGIIPIKGAIIVTLFVLFTLILETICIVTVNKYFPFVLGKKWNGLSSIKKLEKGK